MKRRYGAKVVRLREKIIQLATDEQLKSIPASEAANFKNYKLIPAGLLVNASWNYKTDSDKTEKHLANSIKRQGQVENINVREMDNGFFEVGNGNHRNNIFQKNGQEFVLCYEHVGITQIEFQARCIAQNETRFESDAERLSELVRNVLDSYGDDTFDILPYDDEELNNLIKYATDSLNSTPEKFGTVGNEKLEGSLQERFIVPPFSIFDTRQGYWMERKRAWLALGIRSQESREDVMLMAQSSQSPAVYALKNSMREHLKREPTWDEIIQQAERQGIHLFKGASIFDPVLCEVLYKWFMPSNGGLILDPFAGGSVRGIVANWLGYLYTGIDLRSEQVQANEANALEVLGGKTELRPKWIIGDSLNIQKLAKGTKADLLFSCPPYHDLEIYSTDVDDLSNMPWGKFMESYRAIIQASCKMLKNDRFAVFVVSEIRHKENGGAFKSFVSETIKAFQDCGLHYYNEIILINNYGSMPIRAARAFTSTRKVGRTHQNVLVFYKGDLSKIKTNFNNFEIHDFGIEDEDSSQNQTN